MRTGGAWRIERAVRGWVVAVMALMFLTPSIALAANPIQIENAKPGTTAWRLTNPATNREVEGYASLTGVNRGGRIAFFVNTAESSYTLEIFRLGWYGGLGGRRMTSAIQRRGVRQVIPAPDPVTGLVECNWVDPYLVTVPNDPDPTVWASGVYLVKLTSRSGKQSYITFVVRDDARPSDVLFQSSVTTFQAYNNWGGKSLYGFNSTGERARKVSFNRPYAMGRNPTSAIGLGAGEVLTNVQPTTETYAAGWEINMLRFLEREGYDVSYGTNIDTHADPNLLLAHSAFLSVGHDEYWTWEMRAHVEQAIQRGIHVGFFSANTCYWQIRLEPSASGAADRTIVGYKGVALTEDPLALDGSPANDYLVTTRFQDPPVSLPEDTLIGVRYLSNPADAEVVITNASHWVFGGTGLKNGDRLTKLVGYEADWFAGDAPPGTVVLAHSPYGSTGYASDMTVYNTASGATVFATGTIQWSWGLDDFNAPEVRPSRLSAQAQQITRNVLARFLGLIPATRPQKPSGLAALAGDQRVSLSWLANGEPNLAGYNLYRSTTSTVATVGRPVNRSQLITNTAFADLTAANGTRYFYTLVAIDIEGDASPASDIVSAMPMTGAESSCQDDSRVTALPIGLDFNGGAAGCLGSGFTTVMPNAGADTSANYVAALVGLAGGTLNITTTPGDPIRDLNTQQNALALRFDATAGAEISTTIQAPLGIGENYDSAGLWFGLGEDGYLKLVVANEGQPSLEIAIEENGAFGGPGRVLVVPLDLASVAQSIALKVTLLPGAGAGTIEASYSVDGGAPIPLGSLSSVPPAFFSPAAYAGVIQTNSNNSTPFLVKYEAFAVAAPSGAPTVTCPDDSRVTSLPVSLQFEGGAGACAASGFTTVMPNAAGGDTANHLPSLVSTAGGALRVTTTAGEPVRAANNQQNAMAVRVAASQPIEVSATIRLPLAVNENYDSAGLWFGLNEDNYVKLAAASNDFVSLELSIEENGVFGGEGRALVLPFGLGPGTSSLRLVMRLTPGAGTNGVGNVDALFSLDGGALVSAGSLLSVPAAFFTAASYAGVLQTNVGNGTPFMVEYDAFTIAAFTPGGPNPTSCPDDARVTPMPVALVFDGAAGGCLASGFTTVMPNAGTNVTPNYEPSRLALAGGALNITTTAGDPARDTDSQQNALAVRVDATAALELSAVLKAPLGMLEDYDSAGLWFGLTENHYVKLTAAVNGGAMLELSMEDNGIFGGPDRLLLVPLPFQSAATSLKLVMKLTPLAGLNGAGVVEAWYSLDGGALQHAGTLGSVPATFFTASSYAGLVHTNSGNATPFVATYDAFAVAPIVPPDTTAPASPAGLAATAGDRRVTLSWTPNSEVDLAGYRVYRGTTATVSTTGTPLSGTTPIAAASYVDAAVSNGTTYYYVVVAVDIAGNASAASTPASAKPRRRAKG